ncbi:ATP-grasp domain-containing protein [Streptomyces sp. FH025]|uniref:ATP-grasp domain-containing protein n=1 Tax=Streptomyces sp. FH025 TaxID=2815937 RepID=UPI001AA00922|nr:ATP-grasp domain-containing protein [Streptomyces sp. FH025]MBO1416847.1 ATP-grasp domain-containing protein [Streptomyces sp. FH025]
MSAIPPPLVAVVDGYSSGAHLVRELLDRGAACLHVRSSPTVNPYYQATFNPSHYVDDLGHDPDPAAVAARLTARGIQHVVAGTESGVALADHLAHLTGRPGNVLELAPARRNKFRMAEALADAGLDAPRSTLATDPDEAAQWFTGSGSDAVVVKPVDSAASDHVRICRNAVEVSRAAADVLESANLFGTPNRTVLLQEFLEGPEYYVNTVSVDGRHLVVETWRYTKSRTPDGAPVFDFEEPADPESPQVQGLHRYLSEALTALGIRNGAAHSEVVLTSRGPVLIDPGARLGGGVLPWVSAKLAGHSHAGLLAAGIVNPPELSAAALPLRWERPIRYVSLINHFPGTVADLGWRDRLADLPTAVAVAALPSPGTHLPRTHDLLTSPGFLYLSGTTHEEVEADYRTIRGWERSPLYTGP